MATINRPQSDFERKSFDEDLTSKASHVSHAASDLLKEGKKLANELYEDGVDKLTDAQQNVKEYSDELLKKVHENPLTSLLIAGGIGFLLSTFLRK